MPCAQPIQAWRPANGGPLKFKAPQDGRAYNPIQIPCGYCILCREEYARQTAVRIVHEATMHEENSFVTLSYDDKHLPPYGGLQYDDLQRFCKRIRKRLGNWRYYAVGEYGDESLRPHYHLCVFGQAFTKDRIILKQNPYLLWTSPWLEEAWGHGIVSVGALNFATARYTASYVVKKLKQKQQYVRVDEETGELIALQQPQARMSRNLGRAWWDQWKQYTHDHDTVIIDGRKQKPPKAYDKWTKESGEAGEKKLEQIKERRKKSAVKETVDQSHARAKNAHARVRRKTKTV